MGTKVEISIDNIPSLLSAVSFGASSIDICASLCLGGLTPSAGFVQKSLDLSPIPLHVLIRPRTGNYVYTDEEVDIMISDIKFMQLLGVQGVSFAALTSEGSLDEFNLSRLMRASKGLEVTFHRAFDLCLSEDKLETITELGFSRVAVASDTSGLIRFSKSEKNKIVVMPIFSLSQENINETINNINTAQVQLTALSVEPNPQQVRFTLNHTCTQQCESCQVNIASYELDDIIK